MKKRILYSPESTKDAAYPCAPKLAFDKAAM